MQRELTLAHQLSIHAPRLAEESGAVAERSEQIEDESMGKVPAALHVAKRILQGKEARKDAEHRFARLRRRRIPPVQRSLLDQPVERRRDRRIAPCLLDHIVAHRLYDE